MSSASDRPSYKSQFSRFLDADPGRLHFAAHSHHLWPDVTYAAHERAWQDAARMADRKWDTIFGEVVPRSREHIAHVVGLPDPSSLAFASNTHQFLVRLLSCFEDRTPVRILSTDAEFHSFARQSRRWEEAGVAIVDRIPAEPFETFPDRFFSAARAQTHDLVFVSHVFFNSGYVFDGVFSVAGLVRDDTFVVIDGYHGFMALPTDLGSVQDRVFYLAGGYKYAMSGEGVCFMHCPPGWGARPVDTGWFAVFGDLERDSSGDDRLPYSRDGHRFMGATLEPTPFYRFNAVMELWRGLRVTVADMHAHVGRVQKLVLDEITAADVVGLRADTLLPGRTAPDRGHFLTFRTPSAQSIHEALLDAGVITDYRGDRLRFGVGIYHDDADVAALGERLRRLG